MTHTESEKRKRLQLCSVTFALLSMLLGGCITPGIPEQHQSDERLMVLRVGDNLKITFSGAIQSLPDHEDQVKEDGTINPPLIGPMTAKDKSPLELAKELQQLYSKYYQRISVNVRALDWHYTVGGEVRTPGRLAWIGGSSVVKTIKAAGDVTDFADRKRVVVTRANGRSFRVNYKKALEDSTYDSPVYPGDIIHVPRRGF
jgi:protein involved in polysaccharide export with SLBB domain